MDTVNCQKPTMVRVDAFVNISGKYGTSTWTRQDTDGCTPQTSSVTDIIRSVRATDKEITGIFQNNVKVSGWFHWTYKDNDKKHFTGMWGYGELDDSPVAEWNSL